MLLQNAGHGPEQREVAFAGNEASDGQEKRRRRGRLTDEGSLVRCIVGFSKRFVSELLLFMVVVHRPEHLVVHTVEYGLTHPVFWWLVPPFKFPFGGFGNGDTDTRMLHTGLLVLGVISPGQQDGQIVRVFPRRRFFMSSRQLHAFSLTNPTSVEG